MASQHLRPPYRAEHIGSLRRPEYLLEKRAQFDSGKIGKEELRPTEEKAIREIVELQRKIGIKAVTDGEYTRSVADLLRERRLLNKCLRVISRHMFFDGVFNNLDGFEHIADGKGDVL